MKWEIPPPGLEEAVEAMEEEKEGEVREGAELGGGEGEEEEEKVEVEDGEGGEGLLEEVEEGGEDEEVEEEGEALSLRGGRRR